MRFLLLLLLPIFSFAQNGLVTIKLGGSPLSSSAWNLNGNSIVDTNFLGTTNSRDLIFKTKNTEAMRIDTLGNVGIGTAAPDHKLSIGYSPLPFQAKYAMGSLIGEMGLGNVYGGFGYSIMDSTLGLNASFSGSETKFESTIANTAASANWVMTFSEKNFRLRFSPLNVFYADTAGLVGIGTANPTSKLHVNGDVRIEGTDSVTIYALTPSAGTFRYCTNCTGNGITGRLLGYIASAWRRFTMD